jgi:prefoldin subunit 5
LSEKLTDLERHRKTLVEKKEELERRKEKVQAALGDKVQKLNQLKEQHAKTVTQRQEHT